MTRYAVATFLAACSVPEPPVAAPIRGIRPVVESRVIEAVNAERRYTGLSNLVVSDVIRHEARVHSADMRDGTLPLGHSGFDDRIAAIDRTIVVISAGENITTNRGFADPSWKAVSDWTGSSEHLANMTGDFDLTGVGVVEGPEGVYWFTQIFVATW